MLSRIFRLMVPDSIITDNTTRLLTATNNMHEKEMFKARTS